MVVATPQIFGHRGVYPLVHTPPVNQGKGVDGVLSNSFRSKSCMRDVFPNDNVVSVYSVDHVEPCKPFEATITLRDGEGRGADVKAFFDDGAMVAAMDTRLYERLCKQMGGWYNSPLQLRMASGALVGAAAAWRGLVELGGVAVDGDVVVFDSGGGWDFLFGKPLLKKFQAVHDYAADTVTVRGLDDRHPQLVANENTAKSPVPVKDRDDTDIPVVAEVSNGAELKDPTCGKPQDASTVSTQQTDIAEEIRRSVKEARLAWCKANREEAEARAAADGRETARRYWKRAKGVGARRWGRWQSRSSGQKRNTLSAKEEQADPVSTTPANNVPICAVVDAESPEYPDGAWGSEMMMDGDAPTHDRNIFTRHLPEQGGAFQPDRVAEILRQVSIGDDLTDDQCTQATELIASFADCFALSVSEVNAVDGAVHTLNVEKDAKFSRKVHQRALTPPQRQYLHAKIDELVAAGVIEQCDPSEVKCVSPITLV